ncbi:MAG: hypothetical protein F4094_08000 [Synechococcus sp. SB0672_bin_6]|nr:hypothetical protein [Synechococcus sp. SB0672_bin_6]
MSIQPESSAFSPDRFSSSAARCLGWGLAAALLGGLPAVAHAQPTLSLGGPVHGADEGDSGTRNLKYTVSLSEPVSRIVLWRICFSSGSGIGSEIEMATLDTSGGSGFRAGTDYRLQENHKATPTAKSCTSYRMFSASSRSLSQTPVHVQVNGETVKERDERIVATLETFGPNPGAVLGTRAHVHWIYNDDSNDADGAIVVKPDTLSVTEGQSATFTVKLNAAPVPAEKMVTVGISGSVKDEIRAAAYIPSFSSPRVIVTPATLGFTKDDWSDPKTFTVTVVEDDDSGNETMNLRLNAGQGFVYGVDTRNYNRVTANLPVNIIDAGPPPTTVLPEVSVTAARGSVYESVPRIAFTVRRTGPRTSPLVVGLSVSEKTSDGQEYLRAKQKGNHTFVIPAGSASVTVLRTIVSNSVAEPDGEVRVAIRKSDRYSIDSAAGEAAVAVEDDDGPVVVSITAANGPVTEGAGAMFTVTRKGGDHSRRMRVNLSVGEDTSGGQDFLAGHSEGDQRVWIVQASRSETYRVTTVADRIDEPDGEVRVSIRPGDGYIIDSARREAAVAVKDSDAPWADFAAQRSSAREGAGARNVRVNLSRAPQSAITLNYAVGGTATAGSDFSIANSGSVRVPADATSVTIPVSVTDDPGHEPDRETVVLTLMDGTGYVVGASKVHTLTIDDNDDPPPGAQVVSVAGGPAVTEGGNAVFTLTRTRSGAALTVGYTVADAELSNFLAAATEGAGSVTFDADETEKDVTVATVADGTNEQSGPVTVTVNRGAGYVVGAARTAAVTVRDDDGVDIAVSPGSLREGETVRFTLSNVTDGSLHPTVIPRPDDPGTATRNVDYAIKVTGRDSFELTGLADRVTEGDETIRLWIDLFGSPDILAVITLKDTPPQDVPVATFALAESSAGEDAGSKSVRVDFSRRLKAPLTLHYTVSGTAGSGDYSIVDKGSLDAVASWTGVSIPVGITDDTNDEPDETVILKLSEGAGYLLGSETVHTLTIEDDDEPRPEQQVVSVSAGAEPVAEGTDAAFTLTRTGLALTPLTVRLAVAETAAAGGDFVASGDEGNLEAVFPAGSSSVTYNVPTQDDGTDEPDGGVGVTVRNGPGYHRSNTKNAASIAVTDDDATEVRLSASSDDIAENGGTKVLTVATGRPLVSPEALTVPLVFSDGARRGTDYRVACGTAAGVTCRNLDADRPRIDFEGPSAQSVTLTLAAIDDGIDEGLGERVSVGFGTLDATSGTNLAGGVTGIGTAAFRIDDDDTTALTVSPVLSGAEFWEGETLEVTVSGIPADYTAVTLAAAGGTAVRGTDYRLLRAGGAVLGANDTLAPSGGSVTFRVRALTDSAAEGDETVALRLDDPGGTLDTALGTLTLTDGARPVLPAAGAMISKTALILVEGGPSGRYTVALTRAPKAGQTVTVTAASGDAGAMQVAGPDGVRGASAVLSFTAADWNAPKTVKVHAREDADGTDENVNITHTVAGPGDWAGAPASGVRVTVDDDEGLAPRVSIEAGPAIDEGGFARFTVRVNPAPPQGLGVRVQVEQDGAYVSPHQAQMGMRFVRIHPGSSTANLWVRTEDDRMGEADGAVKARVIVLGSAYRLGSPNRAQVAVRDNDGGAVTLSVADATANERRGSMEFTATLSKAVSHPVLFRVRTRETNPVSATAGDDYRHDFRHLDREIRIWPGRTSVSFWVRIFDDLHDDGGERFEVVLSEVRGADVGDGVAVGTITNDDPVPVAFLARFGRTVAEQSLVAVSRRFSASRVDSPDTAGPFDSFDSTDPDALNDATGDAEDYLGNLLTAGFAATGAEDALGGNWSFWGRAAEGSFDGAERGDGMDIFLDGTVTTGFLGADYARDGWLMGTALAHSSGDGKYWPIVGEETGEVEENEEAGSGTLETSLTAVVPYVSMQATEAIRIRGVAGRGTGEVTLEGMEERYSADTEWTMAALGLSGVLSGSGNGGRGMSLEWISDALWARTSSDSVPGLAGSESDITRLRLGLEGGWKILLDHDTQLTLSLELGIRQDGGDAETGSGVEVGGGLSWRDPQLGLALEVSGRMLVSHEDDDLEDRGFSASVAYDRDPSSSRGLSLSLRQETGGQSSGGLEALFAPTPFEDHTAVGNGTGNRWKLEVAYGLPVLGGRFMGSPHAGFSHSADARDWTVGWRLVPESSGAPDVSFGPKAVRREAAGESPKHVLGFEFTGRW